MNRRELFRNTLVTAIAATSATVPASARYFPPGTDADKELSRHDWQPVFLDSHQNQTLIVLSDFIIPATDTAGAKDALVNRFLDLLIGGETAEVQRAFINALAYIDGESMKRYGSAFVYLPRQQQIDYLTFIAYPHSLQTWGESNEEFPGYQHFEKLKGWIAGAYYNSPAGLKEMGWDGTFPHGDLSMGGHSSPTGKHDQHAVPASGGNHSN